MCSGYAASSSPLSRVSLTQGEGVGWGGVDEASVRWMDELHLISTGDEVSGNPLFGYFSNEDTQYYLSGTVPPL